MTAQSPNARRKEAQPPRTRRHSGGAVLAGALRVVGRVLRGLIATAVLVALVAGLPWALWHYISWPLPDHVPTLTEIHAVLVGPMTTTFLLDFLACTIWIVWVAFTIDVLRRTVNLIRGGFSGDASARLPDFSAAGPIHALAGVLIGAILLSVLGNRPAPAPAASLSTMDPVLGSGGHVVATAPAWQHPAPVEDIVVRDAVVATQTLATGAATDSAPTHPVSVVVLAPHDGVYDSLWRIAQRTLGDGARWPEIFDLNKGKPQPNGRPFTQPSLIFPGEELALPADATAPNQPAQPPQRPSVPTPTVPAPTTAPPTSTPAPSTTAPPTSVAPSSPAVTPALPAPSRQPPAATGTHPRPTETAEPGFTWGPDLFVGLGLAAAVSAALLVARRRYRARYRPGSGDRDDLPVAPVVYQLRLAHLRAETDDEIDLDDDHEDDATDSERPRPVPPPPALVVGTPAAGTPERRGALAPGLGVRDGRDIALDLAVARGLGLIGAGTSAAIRALLIAALTAPVDAAASHGHTAAGTSVVVPAADLAAVLGRATAQADLPTGLRVVADLEEALDTLEAETLVRAASRDRKSWSPLVLVARPPQHHQRLQAVLDNGAPFGITGLLLGQWQPGVTCYVREDGTISATGPGLGEALRGTRVFHLGDDHTAALLTLLRQAEPEPFAEAGQDDRIDQHDRLDVGTPQATWPRIVPVRGEDDRAPNDTGGPCPDHADRGGTQHVAEPVPTRSWRSPPPRRRPPTQSWRSSLHAAPQRLPARSRIHRQRTANAPRSRPYPRRPPAARTTRPTRRER